jgi:predicted DCC family thiol-disulfide oxidoreductase YuxK
MPPRKRPMRTDPQTTEQGPRVSPPDRPTLIFDGECGFCRDSVRVLQRSDREGRIAVVPFQDPTTEARFGIKLPTLAAAMHLVLPDGRVFAGADALPELGRLLPGKRWLTWLFAVPGVRPIARRVYARIAARRRCLVRPRPAG